MTNNELIELMKKAKVQRRTGYDQLQALRFYITFRRNKRKYSEPEFRSLAAMKNIDLGGYQDMKALLNQGRDMYRKLELVTDRDLAAEIQPLPMFEDPELFPAEVPEPKERSLGDCLDEIISILSVIEERLGVLVMRKEPRE